MRKRLFMLAALLLLVGLALGTRYGDVVLYTADWAFAAATLVVFAAFCFWWLPDHPLVSLSTDWTSLLLPTAVLALMLLSPYGYGAQIEAAKLGSAFLLAIMVLNLVQERGDLQFFLNGILFLGVGMAAVSFAYYMAAMSPLFYFTPLWAQNLQYHFVVSGQLWGLWQYHNSFAAILVLCTLLSLGMATGDKRRDWRLLYSTCAGFLLMVLYLTTSRGAFLTGVIGLGALVLLAPRGWRGRVLLRVLVIGAAAAGFTLLNRVAWATAEFNAEKATMLGTCASSGIMCSRAPAWGPSHRRGPSPNGCMTCHAASTRTRSRSASWPKPAFWGPYRCLRGSPGAACAGWIACSARGRTWRSRACGRARSPSSSTCAWMSTTCTLSHLSSSSCAWPCCRPAP
jgi:hypothetical protein